MYRIAVSDDDQRELEENMNMTRSILSGKGMVQAQDYQLDGYLSPEPLLEKLAASPKAYDLLLLDIEMPTENGLELAHLLRKKQFEASIIYITNYPRFALDSFSTFPLEYLLKPADEARLTVALERDLRRINPPRRPLLQTGTGALFLEDILYLEIVGHKTAVHTRDEMFLLTDALSSLRPSLLEQGFAVPHFSFLVNLAHVKQIERTCRVLDNGKNIPVSRRCYQSPMEQYIDHLA